MCRDGVDTASPGRRGAVETYHRRQAGLVAGLRLPTVLLAELTCQGVDGGLGEVGHDVDLVLAELASQQVLGEGAAGEAAAGEGDGRGGGGAELQAERRQQSVDDGSLETQRAGEDAHQESDQSGEERGEQLGEDDGGEHGDEERQQLLQLAQVQTAVILLVRHLVVAGAVVVTACVVSRAGGGRGGRGAVAAGVAQGGGDEAGGDENGLHVPGWWSTGRRR